MEGIKVNRRDGNANADGNRIVGNVVYGLSSGQGRAYFIQGNERMKDNYFSNNVSIGNAVGIYQRNDENLLAEYNTIVSPSEKGVLQSGYPNAQSCDWRLGAQIQTSVILDAPVGISRSSKFLELPASCPTTAYGNLTATGNHIAASAVSENVENGSACNQSPVFDTERYGFGAYLFANTCSGKQLGAEVLYQLQDTAPTEQSLWPWPMEERILNESGQSVTYASSGGLWKQLP
ncbi:MAG: hypothetical protein IPJ88_05165 [Myxococcales bacterium]|nr:MAG: hypothetical protein IPJ88_05165 [Myxococcales bacterium]